MRQLLILLFATLLLGVDTSSSYAQEKKWDGGAPTFDDLETKVSDKLCRVDELVRVELTHERKGSELTLGELETGGFASLYFNYYYAYEIKFADTILSSFKMHILLNPQEEKLQELEVFQYFFDSRGKIASNKPKNINIVRKKIDKSNITIELTFQDIKPMSFYYITYIVKSSNLKSFKPKTIEGNIVERQSRLSIEVPDFIQYNSNYSSLDVKLHSVEKSLFFLKTFSVADVRSYSADSYTDTEQRSSKLIKLIIDDHQKFYSNVFFNVANIDISKNNKFGLNTSKFPVN